MSHPLMSIAIAAYNHSAYIEDCLASVCAQTYPNLELVLIDDGSSDDTFAKAERFLENRKDRFQRVLLKRQENQGVSAASNACIEACSGEWVHLLGSDDVLYPDKVMNIWSAIESWHCPELAMVFADADYIDQGGQKINVKRRERAKSGPDFHAYQWIFFDRYDIHNPTITLRRDAFMTIGGFDGTLILEDLDGWLRLSTRYAIAFVPEILAGYRIHPGNTSRKRLRMHYAKLQTYAKFLSQHEGLIANKDIRRHFRHNIIKLWRRVKKHHSELSPKLLPLIVRDALRAFWRTPEAKDYAHYANILSEIKEFH